MNIKFHLATTEDIKTILGFMKAFYAIDKYPFDENILKKCLNEFVENSLLGKIWIIKNDEKAIGYIVLTYGYSFEFHGKDAFIDEFYIEEKYRGQGVGTKTIGYVLDAAKQDGVNAVHLETERHNEIGRRIYKKFDFKDHDRILMTRFID